MTTFEYLDDAGSGDHRRVRTHTRVYREIGPSRRQLLHQAGAVLTEREARALGLRHINEPADESTSASRSGDGPGSPRTAKRAGPRGE